jgi:hypothetical protein
LVDDVMTICVFRRNPATRSGPIRPLIPVHSGHPIRSIPATDSGQSGHPFRSIRPPR